MATLSELQKIVDMFGIEVIAAVLGIGAIGLAYFVFNYSLREKTFEEALAEQREGGPDSAKNQKKNQPKKPKKKVHTSSESSPKQVLGWLTDWLIGGSLRLHFEAWDWLIDWLIICLNDQLIDWLIDWLKGISVIYLLNVCLQVPATSYAEAASSAGKLVNGKPESKKKRQESESTSADEIAQEKRAVRDQPEVLPAVRHQQSLRSSESDSTEKKPVPVPKPKKEKVSELENVTTAKENVSEVAVKKQPKATLDQQEQPPHSRKPNVVQLELAETGHPLAIPKPLPKKEAKTEKSPKPAAVNAGPKVSPKKPLAVVNSNGSAAAFSGTFRTNVFCFIIDKTAVYSILLRQCLWLIDIFLRLTINQSINQSINQWYDMKYNDLSCMLSFLSILVVLFNLFLLMFPFSFCSWK